MADHIPAWIDGVLTPVEKMDVHLRALRHRAVSVFLLFNNALLIQRRALNKYHTPGLWANTCCTHPAWDEDSLVCANRRLTEELNIKNIDLKHRGKVEYKADVGGGMVEHEVVDIFVGHVNEAFKVAPNPSEVMDTKWVAIPELLSEISSNPDVFTPWLRIYLHDHADQIFQDS